MALGDPIDTIWTTARVDPMAYSIDGGSSWVPVSTAVISSSVYSNGLCGPKTVWKFYSQFDESKGIWYFDETGWHSELLGFSAYVGYNKPGSEIWCNEDDTLVVSVSSGFIRTRDGAPGTSWVLEYSGSSYIYDVHGTPDGSSVFAVQSVSNSTVNILERTGGGTWSVAHSFSGTNINGFIIRVVSDTEVWVAGRENGSGKIWKWNGSTLTEAFSDPNMSSLGVMAMYMAEDGSEGWAAYRSNGATYETSFIYYNGSTWAITQSVSYDSYCTDITQLDGDPTSAKLMLENGSIREYSGSAWDTTYSVAAVTGCATPVRTFKWVHQRVPGVPYLNAKSPTGATPDPQTLVSVDILDSDDDLDASSLVVYVDDGTGEVTAYTAGGGFVAPYNGASSAVTTITNGLNVVLDRTTDYPPGTVTPRITISDTILNSINESWSFLMDYVYEPYLENQTPTPSSYATSKDFLIEFDLLDAQDDLDITTLNVYVDVGAGEVQAYQAGVGFLAPYNGGSSALTPITNGYHVVVDRTTDYPNDVTTTVRVTADDTAAHSMDDSWSFGVAYLDDRTLWMISLYEPISYSFVGAEPWNEVYKGFGTYDYAVAICGPRSPWKFYTLVVNRGVCSYDGATWSIDSGCYVYSTSDAWQNGAVFCADDDSIVVAAPYTELRTRPGGPGTSWVVEYTSSYRFYDVHGTPDGASIYAVWYDGNGHLFKRAGGGTWSSIASVTGARFWKVRVISDTEVWVSGIVSSRAKIWKWDGATLSEIYDDPAYTYQGMVGLWMARDGSEGWAYYRNGTNTILRYNGTTWSVSASGLNYSEYVEDIAQFEGEITTAVILLRDRTVRRYDGAAWDTTYAGTETIPGGDYPVVLSYIPYGYPVEPYLKNQTPIPLSTISDPQFLIDVDVLDYQDDIDASTINVYVNDGGGEVLAYNGSSFIAPYNGPSSAVTPVTDGYNVVVDRTTDYLPDSIVVRVTAEDVLANAMDEFWTFDIWYPLAPYLENQSPAQDDYLDLVSFDISFDLVDLQDDIDTSTIAVYVNDGTGEVTAYTDAGGFVAPYNGGASSITPIANGFTIVLDRTTDYPRNVITVRVVADDFAAHSLNGSWDFTVSPWVEKTALLPTQEDIPLAGDTYSAGTFTTVGSNRRMFYTNSSAPIAYETLDSIGASAAAILRVTARVASNNGISNWVGGDITIYGPDRSDQFWVVAQDSSSTYRTYLFRTIDGVHQSAGSVAGTLAAPKLIRMYWNASYAPFVIPEPGFGSYSIPARTASGWFSEDDGATWTRAYDGVITGNVNPTRVGIGSENYYQSAGSIVTFDQYQVAQIDPPAPYLQNQFPEPSSTTTAIGTLVSVDIVDFQDDIDTSTLEVTVNSVPAYSGGAFVAPFDGPSSALTKITNGYNLTIDNTDPYLTGAVTTRVIVEDVLAHSMDSSWLFNVNADPYLANQSPASGTTENDDDLLISVDVLDYQSDIDLATLNVTVNTVPAYTAGVGFVSPYDGASSSVVAIMNGYRVTLDRTTSFLSGTTDTRVTVDDVTGNSLDSSWSFTFDGDPYLGPTAPADGEYTGNRSPVIVIDILDHQDDIDVSTIDVTVNAVPACTSGVFVAPYDGPESSITAISGGVRVKADYTGSYTGAWSVNVAASDLAGNSFTDSFSFESVDRETIGASHWIQKVDYYLGDHPTIDYSGWPGRGCTAFVPGIGLLWLYTENVHQEQVFYEPLPWRLAVYDGNKWEEYWKVSPNIEGYPYGEQGASSMVYDPVRDVLICVFAVKHPDDQTWADGNLFVYPEPGVITTYEISLNGGGTPTVTKKGDMGYWSYGGNSTELNQDSLVWDSVNNKAYAVLALAPSPLTVGVFQTVEYDPVTGTWAQVAVVGVGGHPPYNGDPHHVGFNKATSQLILTNGYSSYSEIYGYTPGGGWTLINGSSVLPGRIRAGITYNDSLGGLVIVGGYGIYYYSNYLNGIWLFNGSDWVPQYYTETDSYVDSDIRYDYERGKVHRSAFHLAYDSDRDRMIMHTDPDRTAEAYYGGPSLRDTREFEIDHPPHLRNRYPTHKQRRVLENQNVQFDICDVAYDIDFSSIHVTIGGEVAYTSGSFVAPFNGPESSFQTSPSEGFRMILDRTEDFAVGSTVEVVVTVDDLNGDSMYSSWEFDIFEQPSSGSMLWLVGDYASQGDPSHPGVLFSQNQGYGWEAVDMTDVYALAGDTFVAMGGVCGPGTANKIYSLADQTGVVAYQNGHWTLEEADPDVSANNDDREFGACGVWCAADDSIVVAWRLGYYYEEVRVRPGPPGTAWATELSFDPFSSNEEPFDAHGSPDGSAVFCVTWDYDASFEYGRLYRRESGGTWTKVAELTSSGEMNVLQVRVVNATEVYMFGGYDDGVTYHATIWKWDGVSVSVVGDFVDGVYGSYLNPIYSAWMSADGSEAMALLVPTGNSYPSYGGGEVCLRYDGVSWDFFQQRQGTYWCTALAQLDGNIQSAVWLNNTYYNSQVVAYDGYAFYPDYGVHDEQYTEHTIAAIPKPGGMYAVLAEDRRPFNWITYITPSSPPYLANLSPYDGEVGVLPDGNIVLDILDDDSSVNAASVVIKVNGETAWQGDTQQQGFVVTKTSVSLGLRYEINPNKFLPPGVTLVEVYAEDIG